MLLIINNTSVFGANVIFSLHFDWRTKTIVIRRNFCKLQHYQVSKLLLKIQFFGMFAGLHAKLIARCFACIAARKKREHARKHTQVCRVCNAFILWNLLNINFAQKYDVDSKVSKHHTLYHTHVYSMLSCVLIYDWRA